MAITDLTGTKWQISQNFSITIEQKMYLLQGTAESEEIETGEPITFSIERMLIANNSTSKAVMLGQIGTTPEALGSPNITCAQGYNVWNYMPYPGVRMDATAPIVAITGGDDATNSVVIAWFEANATQIVDPPQDWLYKFLNDSGLMRVFQKLKTVLDKKAALDVSTISTAGGGTEVHANVSQSNDEVSFNYYKQGTELPDYVNLSVNGDGFSFPTRNSVDNKVPFVATYEQATYADVTAAIDADRSIVVNFPANRNLICVTYSTYVQSQNVLMYGIFKSQNWVSLATITLTPANAWRVTHTKLQELLESGINIKTVNNQSVLGSGNIDIPGGGGSDTVILTYGVTEYSVVKDAIDSNKRIVVKLDSFYYPVTMYGVNQYSADLFKAQMCSVASIVGMEPQRIIAFSVRSDTNGWATTSLAVQEELQSGTNLKTVNGQSLLGSGNLDIGGGTVDTAMSDTSENAVQNKVIKSYVDGKTGNLSTLTTDDKTSLVNAINEVYEKSGEPFRVKNWANSSLNVSIPYCTEEVANTSIAKMTYSIDAEEGASYQIVGMIAYEVFDSNNQRINCWPVCQFTGNGQKELSVRWACMGSSRKTATKINAWVLLKHR